MNFYITFLSILLWIIITLVVLVLLYKIVQCICPRCLNLEINLEEDIFEPEPIREVQMVENIAGRQVVIAGFV